MLEGLENKNKSKLEKEVDKIKEARAKREEEKAQKEQEKKDILKRIEDNKKKKN